MLIPPRRLAYADLLEYMVGKAIRPYKHTTRPNTSIVGSELPSPGIVLVHNDRPHPGPRSGRFTVEHIKPSDVDRHTSKGLARSATITICLIIVMSRCFMSQLPMSKTLHLHERREGVFLLLAG